jgi:hypothetical protein
MLSDSQSNPRAGTVGFVAFAVRDGPCGCANDIQTAPSSSLSLSAVGTQPEVRSHIFVETTASYTRTRLNVGGYPAPPLVVAPDTAFLSNSHIHCTSLATVASCKPLCLLLSSSREGLCTPYCLLLYPETTCSSNSIFGEYRDNKQQSQASRAPPHPLPNNNHLEASSLTRNTLPNDKEIRELKKFSARATLSKLGSSQPWPLCRPLPPASIWCFETEMFLSHRVSPSILRSDSTGRPSQRVTLFCFPRCTTRGGQTTAGLR